MTQAQHSAKVHKDVITVVKHNFNKFSTNIYCWCLCLFTSLLLVAYSVCSVDNVNLSMNTHTQYTVARVLNLIVGEWHNNVEYMCHRFSEYVRDSHALWTGSRRPWTWAVWASPCSSWLWPHRLLPPGDWYTCYRTLRPVGTHTVCREGPILTFI